MQPANYLLDTNAISEAVKSRQDKGYMDWLSGTEDSCLYVSCLTLGEIQKGISLATDPALRRRLDSYLAGLYTAFSGRIVDLSAGDCVLWGKLTARAQMAGRTAPVLDSLIAAQCMQHQMVLVTRNVKDFEQFAGLEVYCPWTV